MAKVKNLVVATQNLDKLREIRKILEDLPVNLVRLPKNYSCDEGTKSIAENAVKKAETAARVTNETAVADDTGLEVATLNGLPGVESSRFAGPDATYADNRKKLLKMLEAKPDTERHARFKCVVAVAEIGKPTRTFEGTIAGYITKQEKGNNGFGYDSIFLIPEMGKTFAEIPLAEKNKISHRARALLKAKEYLKKQLSA